jgi:pimeloyl-ACP methyl ester carboxylesterase
VKSAFQHPIATTKKEAAVVSTAVKGWVATAAERLKRWAGPGSGSNVGWLKNVPPPVRDASAQFGAVYGAAKAGSLKLPSEAKDHQYLLVGGLFTNQYPGYMDSNQKALTSQGLSAKRVPVDTGQSVDVNAKAIRDAILAASKDGKKVVLVGQSKGAVDITAALAKYPELKPHVRAVVAMQAPYGGTPIASDLPSNPQLRPLLQHLIGGVMQGDIKSLTDLSYEARKAFIEKYPYPTDIPTVSLATSRDSRRSIVDATGRYLKDRYGARSDGLVVAQDAEIPGSRVVRLDNMDHAESVMEGAPGFPEHRPTPLTVALVALALQEKR